MWILKPWWFLFSLTQGLWENVREEPSRCSWPQKQFQKLPMQGPHFYKLEDLALLSTDCQFPLPSQNLFSLSAPLSTVPSSLSTQQISFYLTLQRKPEGLTCLLTPPQNSYPACVFNSPPLLSQANPVCAGCKLFSSKPVHPCVHSSHPAQRSMILVHP